MILTEAGYLSGFSLKMSYPTRPMHGIATEAMAAKIQADLKAVGIDLALEPKVLRRRDGVPGGENPGLKPAIKGYAIHPIWFVTLARLSR